MAGGADADPAVDFDVAVVGGGPAGCSAGVFTARYELDTVVFDRGNSSIGRCAYLENYPGFPAGIDIETFCALLHDHAREAGCEVVPELVENVERDGEERFRVETQDGRSVTARFVVAATKYDAAYLRGLDDALFREEGSEEFAAAFEPDAVDADGRTPVPGLYVAGPLSGVGDQAIVAAGHGAQVARALIADARRERGYWDGIATRYDWVRRESELTGEWRDRETWVEYFDEHRTPADLDLDEAERERIRDARIDERLSMYVDEEGVEERTARGQRRLAGALDPEHVLDAIDDEEIRAYLADETRRQEA